MPTKKDTAFTWEYRVVKEDTAPEITYQIYSVHYEGGVITQYSDEPVIALGESPEELKGDLELMVQAFTKPILSLKDLKEKLGE